MAVYELPELPYAYDALEPHISAEIMQLHHDKHHATYVAGANAALDALEAERNGEANPDRLRALASSFRRAGVDVRFDLLPGVSHERTEVLPLVQDFLADVLAGYRANGQPPSDKGRNA